MSEAWAKRIKELDDGFKEARTAKGRMVPLTDWELHWIVSLIADCRWEWEGRDGTYGDGPNERLFQKLAALDDDPEASDE